MHRFFLRFWIIFAARTLSNCCNVLDFLIFPLYLHTNNEFHIFCIAIVLKFCINENAAATMQNSFFSYIYVTSLHLEK